MKSKLMTALLNAVAQLPFLFLASILTVIAAACIQKIQEREYVQNLKDTIREEASQNAGTINRTTVRISSQLRRTLKTSSTTRKLPLRASTQAMPA